MDKLTRRHMAVLYVITQYYQGQERDLVGMGVPQRYRSSCIVPLQPSIMYPQLTDEPGLLNEFLAAQEWDTLSHAEQYYRLIRGLKGAGLMSDNNGILTLTPEGVRAVDHLDQTYKSPRVWPEWYPIEAGRVVLGKPRISYQAEF